MNLKDHIRHVPDFPKPGILFYDISTLLAHPDAWAATVERLADDVTPYKPDILVGIESRGFLVTAPLAYKLGLPFVMLRKKGKLPGETINYTYDLEYGTDTVELQKGAVEPDQKVVVMDDLLATGGTMTATVELLRKIGADVKAGVCIIELTFLHGRHRLAEHGVPCHSLIEYEE